MAATPSALFANSKENGLARLLVRRRTAESGWAKLRGTPAAYVVLAIELVALHLLHLALWALADQLAGVSSSLLWPAEEPLLLAQACGMLLAALLLLRLSAAALEAPVAALFRVGRPSLLLLLFAGEELAAALWGQRLEPWKAVPFGRLLRVVVATPLSEEVYFRLVLLHALANRIKSPLACCLLSAAIFAAAHAADGSLLTRLVAGLGLALRFLGSGGNLLEVAGLHALHNAACLASLATQSRVTEPSAMADAAPLLLFGSIAVVDAARLGLLPLGGAQHPNGGKQPAD